MVLVYVLGLPFALAAAAAFVLAPSWRRAAGVAAAGPIVIVAYLVVVLATSSEDDCYHHCGEYFGGWVDPVIFYAAAFATVGWVAGAFVGSAPRLFSERSRLRAAGTRSS